MENANTAAILRTIQLARQKSVGVLDDAKHCRERKTHGVTPASARTESPEEDAAGVGAPVGDGTEVEVAARPPEPDPRPCPAAGGDGGAASSGAAEASVIAGSEPTEGEDEAALAGSEPTEGEEGAASAGAPAVGSGASSRCGPAA